MAVPGSKSPNDIADDLRWSSLGETAIVIDFGNRYDPQTSARVWALGRYLDQHPIHGMVEYVPGYTTVTLIFNPLVVDAADVGRQVERIVPQLRPANHDSTRIVEIPVCYDEAFGPDLPFVAQHAGLTMDEVIGIHREGDYTVSLIGFAPGFPYLSGMASRIATPRRATPRLLVPAGSVGIAGGQTGIYPFAIPGGWQLIGRTPRVLFRSTERPPALLRAGDRVQFRQISADQFHSWPVNEPWQSK